MTRSPSNKRLRFAAVAAIVAVCLAFASRTAWPLAATDEGDGADSPGGDEKTVIVSAFSKARQVFTTAEAAAASRAAREADAAEYSEAEGGSPGQDEGSRTTERIEELLQYPELPAGCEAVALTCVLNAMGYDVAATDIVEDYLSIDPAGVDANSYLGDPYTGGYAFPPAIINAANDYLSDAGSDAQARDISGSSFERLLEIVEAGTPVLVWSTMYFAEPTFTGSVAGPYFTYYNEHCVVLYGVSDDVVLVSDPLEGLVERDRETFERLYEACGSLAVVVE